MRICNFYCRMISECGVCFPLGPWFIDMTAEDLKSTKRIEKEKMLLASKNTNINDRFRTRRWMIHEPARNWLWTNVPIDSGFPPKCMPGSADSRPMWTLFINSYATSFAFIFYTAIQPRVTGLDQRFTTTEIISSEPIRPLLASCARLALAVQSIRKLLVITANLIYWLVYLLPPVRMRGRIRSYSYDRGLMWVVWRNRVT